MPTVAKISGIDVPSGGGTTTDSGVLVDIEEFDPLDLHPIATILDASEGVTQSSNLVSSWVDDNNDDDDYVQATAGSKPTLVAEAYNGQDTIRFDGTDDILISADTDYYLTSLDHTIFLVAKSDATHDAHVAGMGDGDGTDDEFQWGSGFYLTAGKWGIKACHHTGGPSATTGVYLTQTSSATTNLTIVSGKLVTGDCLLRINGATEGLSTATINEWSTPDATGIGAGANTGSDEFLPFNGDICFYLHINRSMTMPEIEATEAYLADRYGVTLV